ncbi:uncharacterized protein LOC129717336 [Wyeomyia smithii]|uniref:uncharacterized protein LOC129717336 n=1 Tax=Wyeomyia smithii TaxID=174621 RepID=UPI0024680EC9|nr:uncharacterized protein LOC129717336 [Wyeomyia smithii]
MVCGDYNQPRIAWYNCNGVIKQDESTQLPNASATLIDGMDFLNLNQANLIRNHLGRVLDLVFYNSDCEISVQECVAPMLPVDLHHPLLTISTPTTKNAIAGSSLPSARRVLNYRQIDFDAFNAFISNIDWPALWPDSNDADSMAANFCALVGSWLADNLPFVRRPSSPAWSNHSLRVLKRKRNACLRKLRRLRSDESKHDFKRSTEEYRRLNPSLYKSYVLGVQTDLRRNPKKFWNFVNSKRKCFSTPTDVYLEEMVPYSDSDSCELFAKFFSSVFASDCASNDDAARAAANVPADLVDLDIFEVTHDMVTAAAKKLKCSYTVGPDGIPAGLLCRCIDILAAPLCTIFNKSLVQGKFPEVWKHSYKFQVFKSGDRRNVKNYRGITNLSAASKLFEIVVSSVILSSARNYISSDQHGFLPGRSVTTNLMHFRTRT